jgi:uncharacterized protein YjbJ (UPF0337 family)
MNKDQVTGKAKEVAGKVQKNVGEATGKYIAADQGRCKTGGR